MNVRGLDRLGVWSSCDVEGPSHPKGTMTLAEVENKLHFPFAQSLRFPSDILRYKSDHETLTYRH